MNKAKQGYITCHPYAGAMLIFSASFQFQRMIHSASGSARPRSAIIITMIIMMIIMILISILMLIPKGIRLVFLGCVDLASLLLLLLVLLFCS